MCFSNLPIEFDEEGNPYLAEEADEVDRVPEATCGCGADADDVPLEDADPEAVYAEIIASMPGAVRERIADGAGEQGSVAGRLGDAGHRESTESD